ncbi:MAG: LysM peptidoglycan-binding domain-containing protein [Betaproteobacteria bacterium]
MRRPDMVSWTESSRQHAYAELGVVLACVVAMACAVGITFGAGRPGRAASLVPSRTIVEVVVAPGDTLWTIARDHVGKEVDIRAAVNDIMARNRLSSAALRPGQVLMVEANVADDDYELLDQEWASHDETVATVGYAGYAR